MVQILAPTRICVAYPFAYGYDASGQRLSVTYPTGETVNTTTNTQNFPKTVSSSSTSYLTNLTYNVLGLPVNLTYGTGPATSFAYFGLEVPDSSPSSFGRLFRITTTAGGSEVERLEYGYDVLGNVTKYHDLSPNARRGREVFTYDALSRLTGAASDPANPNGNDYAATYAYDSIGRLTTKNEGGTSYSLTYDSNRPVHAPKTVNGAGYTYDAQNRLTRAANGSTRLLRVAYDGDGQRVITQDSRGTIVSLNKLYEKNLTTGAETIFVYAGSRLIATKTGGTVSTVHPDHLGGVAVTMQGNSVVADLAFFPYGSTRSTSSGTPPTDRRFNGEAWNQATGLYIMGARWYDPTVGRWLQPDSVVPDFANPQDLNRYAYAQSNPLRYTDPTGHCAVLCVAGVLIGAALTAYAAHDTAPVAGAPAPGEESAIPAADYRTQARAVAYFAPEDVAEGNVEAIGVGVAMAGVGRIRGAGRFFGTATKEIMDRAKAVVASKGWEGTIERAVKAAERGAERLPGLFVYSRSRTIEVGDVLYDQHHLWPTALGGPDAGWVVYIKDSTHTGAGTLQDRLNAFLIERTEAPGFKALKNWARENRDQLLVYLREFYNDEGIEFPY